MSDEDRVFHGRHCPSEEMATQSGEARSSAHRLCNHLISDQSQHVLDDALRLPVTESATMTSRSAFCQHHVLRARTLFQQAPASPAVLSYLKHPAKNPRSKSYPLGSGPCSRREPVFRVAMSQIVLLPPHHPSYFFLRLTSGLLLGEWRFPVRTHERFAKQKIISSQKEESHQHIKHREGTPYPSLERANLPLPPECKVDPPSLPVQDPSDAEMHSAPTVHAQQVTVLELQRNSRTPRTA